MITYIVVGYNYTFQWDLSAISLALQTDNRWKAIFINDGPDSNARSILSKYKDLPIMYIETESRQGVWGHNCRAEALKYVDTEWVNISNGDNYIVPMANQILLDSIEGSDVVMTNLVHSYFNYTLFDTRFSIAYTDMCNFIVRSDIAKNVGFNHRTYAADGLFCEDIKKAYPNLRIKKLNTCLWVHN